MEQTLVADAAAVVDISQLPKKHLLEIAEDIRSDTLAGVNLRQTPVATRDTFYTRYGKRGLDILLSSLALLVSLPVNLVIGVVTFFDVGRPLLFRQTRIGRDRKLFTIYKFRNMTDARDANGDLLPPAQRVTKWGRFVRKTSLDELLNFVSIFKGDMSIIGPRPVIEPYAHRLHDRHLCMFAQRPGLECPFPQALDHPATWQDRLDNYVWYAQNVSFLTDVKLVLRMVGMVLSSDATSQRSVSQGGAFLGYDAQGRVIGSHAVPEKYVQAFLRRHGYADLEAAARDCFV